MTVRSTVHASGLPLSGDSDSAPANGEDARVSSSAGTSSL
jgi:hypothetical protein